MKVNEGTALRCTSEYLQGTPLHSRPLPRVPRYVPTLQVTTLLRYEVTFGWAGLPWSLALPALAPGNFSRSANFVR